MWIEFYDCSDRDKKKHSKIADIRFYAENCYKINDGDEPRLTRAIAQYIHEYIKDFKVRKVKVEIAAENGRTEAYIAKGWTVEEIYTRMRQMALGKWGKS